MRDNLLRIVSAFDNSRKIGEEARAITMALLREQSQAADEKPKEISTTQLLNHFEDHLNKQEKKMDKIMEKCVKDRIGFSSKLEKIIKAQELNKKAVRLLST